MHNITDKDFESLGLVDIKSLIPNVELDLRYATDNNFVGKVLYPSTITRAYCEKETAQHLAEAARYLDELRPGYHFVIWDAARPMSVQREMYYMVKDTPQQNYVANPDGADGAGYHNYGLAVDLTIADANGRLLDMGTDFDSFQALAHPYDERKFLSEGKMSNESYSNRMLLYHVMGHAQMLPHPYEWWHYQLIQDDKVKKQYPLLDF